MQYCHRGNKNEKLVVKIVAQIQLSTILSVSEELLFYHKSGIEYFII